MKKTLLFLSFACLCLTLQAEGFKTQSISVFKNGLAFIQKKATVKAVRRQAVIYDLGTTSDSTLTLKNELLALKFGSLWFRSPHKDLHSVSRYTSATKGKQPIRNLKELLLNNLGQPATFIFRDTHAANDPKLRKDPVKLLADTWTLTGDFLMLSAGGKWSNAHLKDLEGVEFLRKPKLKREVQEEKLGLHLQFNSDRQQQEIEMMYVRDGIYWVPTYHLDLLPGGKGTLRLVANLLNDVEDIEDCSMNFVTGVPNFEFRDIVTPLGSDASIAEFMQELAGKRLAHQGSVQPSISLNSAAFSNSISYNYSVQDQTTTPHFIVQPESDLEDGMYLYTKDHVSLRKGGRALIDLFEKTVPVEKVYHVELPRSNLGILNRAPGRRDVVQSFKLQNTAGLPLTHGPVFVTDSQGDFIRPIANDKILFTPAGMPAYIKAADANDILLYEGENESTSKAQGLVTGKKHTMHGSFNITNMREEPVIVEVTRIIEGTPKQCSTAWDLQVQRKKLRKANQLTKVTWRIELPAQRTQKVEYKYTAHNFN